MKLKNNILIESIISVLPISLLILIINFCLPVSLKPFDLAGFIFGNVLLIGGMALYGKGSKMSLTPVGDSFGSFITMKKKVWLFVVAGIILGFIITIAEPDLSVLGNQLGSIKWTLIITIALGVGVFLAIALLKTLLRWDFTLTIMIMYALVFILSIFVNKNFIPLCFDSGGVTTGALTVPFILALSSSVAGTLGGKNKDENSFGMIALCSVGPIIMTLLLCLIFSPDVKTSITETSCNNFMDLIYLYGRTTGNCFKEVIIALAPIALLFYIFDIFVFKLPKMQILRISIGFLYTYIGLSLFLTGVNGAYMGTGYFIGKSLASTGLKWLLIPIGAVVGLVIVFAEPAVSVLVKQVEEVSSGLIKKRTMRIALALSMALALCLSALRIITGISIWLIIGIGYLLALGLSLFVPKVYTSIAFDSGGVASGPMTATFLLPFAVGATEIIQGQQFVLMSAYGLVATVALMPLITIQIMGLSVKIKENRRKKQLAKISEKIKKEDSGDIIQL